MSKTKSERAITLSESSWALIDGACQFDEKLTPSMLIDAIIQGYASSVDEDKQQKIVDMLRKEIGERG